MNVDVLIYLIAVIAFIILLGVLIRIRFKYRENQSRNRTVGTGSGCVSNPVRTHQQDDIYNISGRVQNQDQWPTNDAHLSIDHISIVNQRIKPLYDDAPPSYEEVMKTALEINGEASVPTQVVVEAPKTTALPETRATVVI